MTNVTPLRTVELNVYQMDNWTSLTRRIASNTNSLPKYIMIPSPHGDTFSLMNFEPGRQTIEYVDVLYQLDNALFDTWAEFTRANPHLGLQDIPMDDLDEEVINTYIKPFVAGILSKESKDRRPLIELQLDGQFKGSGDKIDVNLIWRTFGDFKVDLKREIGANQKYARQEEDVFKDYDEIVADPSLLRLSFKIHKVNVKFNLTPNMGVLDELFDRLNVNGKVPMIQLGGNIKIHQSKHIYRKWASDTSRRHTRSKDSKDTLEFKLYNQKPKPEAFEAFQRIMPDRDPYEQEFSNVSIEHDGTCSFELPIYKTFASGLNTLSVDDFISKIYAFLNIPETPDKIQQIFGGNMILNAKEEFEVTAFLDLTFNDSIASAMYVADDNNRSTTSPSFTSIRDGHKLQLRYKTTEYGIQVKFDKMTDVNKTIESFLKLWTRYKTLRHSIWATYTDYIPELESSVRDMLTLEAAERQRYERNLASMLDLRRTAPEIFPPNFTRRCTHKPKIVDEPEKDGRSILFPHYGETDKQYHFTCKDNTTSGYLYEGLMKNEFDNSGTLPFLPCCFQKDQNVPGTNFDRYYNRGGELPIDTKRQGIRAKALIPRGSIHKTPNRISGQGVFSKLPLVIEETFDNIYQLATGTKSSVQFVRRGVHRGRSSMLQCILETLLQDFTDVTGTIQERLDYVDNFRRDLIARYRHLVPVCAQSVYYQMYKNDIPINRFEDYVVSLFEDVENVTIEGEIFIDLLEEMFGCKIYLFTRDVKKFPHGTYVVPRHQNAYFSKRKENVPILCFYEHYGSETDYAKSKQCESICLWDETKNEVLYDFSKLPFMAEGLKNLHESVNGLFFKNQNAHQLAGGVIDTSPWDDGKNASQYLDANGHVRVLMRANRHGHIEPRYTTIPLPPLAIPMIFEVPELDPTNNNSVDDGYFTSGFFAASRKTLPGVKYIFDEYMESRHRAATIVNAASAAIGENVTDIDEIRAYIADHLDVPREELMKNPDIYERLSYMVFLKHKRQIVAQKLEPEPLSENPSVLIFGGKPTLLKHVVFNTNERKLLYRRKPLLTTFKNQELPKDPEEFKDAELQRLFTTRPFYMAILTQGSANTKAAEKFVVKPTLQDIDLALQYSTHRNTAVVVAFRNMYDVEWFQLTDANKPGMVLAYKIDDISYFGGMNKI